MIVIRYETRDGKGVYDGGLVDQIGYDRNGNRYGHDDMRNPAPWIDLPGVPRPEGWFGSRLPCRQACERAVGAEDGNAIFGFLDCKQRNSWFTRTARERLAKQGAVCVRYSVPDRAVLKGRSQVVFNKALAVRLTPPLPPMATSNPPEASSVPTPDPTRSDGLLTPPLFTTIWPGAGSLKQRALSAINRRALQRRADRLAALHA